MSERERPATSTGPFARPRRWSWVQFWCAFALAAVGNFLYIEVDLQLPAHLLKTFVIALTLACLAGRYGDAAWLWIACLMSC